jgi:hypothetical protein
VIKQLISEIRAKNGLSSIDYNYYDMEFLGESIAFDAVTYANPKPRDRTSRRKHHKFLKTDEANSAKSEYNCTSTKSEVEGRRSETIVAYPMSKKLSLIQSTYGKKGNFELVVPLATGGLAHYSRNNDQEGLPWSIPVIFGSESGRMMGAALIQSDFGFSGNLEVLAVDSGGYSLLHFWRDSGPSFDWHGPIQVSRDSSRPLFSGSPAMIRNNFGNRGNFEAVVPSANGGFYHYWRDNDDPALPWNGPFEFLRNAGRYDAVTLIQSNFGDNGNREMVAHADDRLDFFWRDSGPKFQWNGPMNIARGVSGTPSMIQSTFGNKGNFEVVVPLINGCLGYFWRNNDEDLLPWNGPLMFGMSAGKAQCPSLIQSNFGDPGHLELVAQIEDQLASFWRDSGPDFRWNGPQYLIF